MKKWMSAVLACAACMAALGAPLANAQGGAAAKTYELRIYTASAGRLSDLESLVGSEGLKAFKRHSIENILDATVLEGAPVDGTDSRNMLVLILAHKDRAAANKDWAELEVDHGWTSAWSTANQAGALLAKPASSLYLDTLGDLPTPPIQSVLTGTAPRVFELRKYNTGPERLQNTVDEFKEGIAAILVNSGMTPVIYWKASDQSAFVYLLAHKDREAARASWAAFVPQFRPFLADFNARHLPPATAGASASAKRTPDDNRFLIPTAFSPLR